MIRRADNRAVKVNEAMRGGPGSVVLTEIASKNEMFEKARLFSTILLKPGCGIGYHEHSGECEIFCVVRGTAVYNDDGTEYEITAGDVTIVEDGHGHGVENRSEEDVELVALIPLNN